MSADDGSAGVGRRQLRRVLVGYDGSDASGAASAFALRLAGKGDAEATLVHVCPERKHTSRAARPKAVTAAARQRRQATAEWQRRLDALLEYAAADALVESLVVNGEPAAALLQEAAERDIDLILMGSTGVGWVRGAVLGSVSSHVVEHARCSVMAFRAGQASSPAHVGSIVVGVDGSRGAADALALAAELAAPLNARLVLVHAYEPSVALAPPTPDIRTEMRRLGADILESARHALPPGVEVVEELAEGHTRPALLAACERHGPAVLAVGSRGRGGVKGSRLGGTSRWVLNHAACPVLIARRRPAG